jgi:hypothetical protein
MEATESPDLGLNKKKGSNKTQRGRREGERYQEHGPYHLRLSKRYVQV